MRNSSVAILASFLPFILNAQWNSSPSVNTPECLQANDQQDVRIVTDGKGGAIMAWQDFRNNVGAADVYVQRLDKNGVAKWAVNGVGVCTDASNQTAPSLVEDGTSGAIIVWNDWRNGNKDIYAQKIDSAGNVKWTANGIAVASKASQQQDAKLISDGAGGAIVVWQDSVNGAWDVYAQRINGAGVIQWAAAGVAICTAADAQINPRIETDGAGGAIFVWQDKRNTVDYDIYVQRVNGSGAVQWAANGAVVCNSISTQSNPKIEPDGAGGAIVAWQDKRNGTDYNVYAQRINAGGAIQWANNGVVVCSAAGSQSAVDMTSEGVSGAIIAWKDLRGVNFDIYAQRIDLNGAAQWTANGIGIVIGGASQLNPNVVGDGSGGAIVVWQDSSATNSDVKSQRVNAAGTVQWTAGGVGVGTAAGNQVSPKNVSDGNGGCIYTWQDKRGADYDIYAHHLYIDGTTVDGILETEGAFDSYVYPNPARGEAKIMLPANVGTGELQITFVDILGNIVPIQAVRFDHTVSLCTGNLQPGVYFYQLRSTGMGVSKGKLILAGQ